MFRAEAFFFAPRLSRVGVRRIHDGDERGVVGLFLDGVGGLALMDFGTVAPVACSALPVCHPLAADGRGGASDGRAVHLFPWATVSRSASPCRSAASPGSMRPASLGSVHGRAGGAVEGAGRWRRLALTACSALPVCHPLAADGRGGASDGRAVHLFPWATVSRSASPCRSAASPGSMRPASLGSVHGRAGGAVEGAGRWRRLALTACSALPVCHPLAADGRGGASDGRAVHLFPWATVSRSASPCQSAALPGSMRPASPGSVHGRAGGAVEGAALWLVEWRKTAQDVPR